MKARKKNSRKHHKLVLYSIVIMMVLLVILLIWLINSILCRNRFAIENRTEQITMQRKKDDKGVKTVAWIRVQGTNIDYPVVYAPNYDFTYMTNDFAWTAYDYKELVDVVRVHGHNIKNLSATPEVTYPTHNRFEQLMSFTYLGFVKDNQFVQYTVNGKDYIYRIYSVAYQNGSYLDIYSEYSKKDKEKLIKRSLENSLFDFNVDVKESDKIITLSTCTRMFASEDRNFVVTGRLLRKGEKTNLNKVKKTTKYEEIEEIMKGGDFNDEA